MATSGGPYIERDGLIFGMDTGYGVATNSTATRHYLGFPVTNMLSYGAEFDSWTKARNSGSYPTVDVKVAKGPLLGTLADRLSLPSDGSYPRIYQVFTPSSTATHTFSIWLKGETEGQGCFVGAFRNSPWSLPSSTAFNITTEWVNYSFNITPQDTSSMQLYIGSHNNHGGKSFLMYGALLQTGGTKTVFTDGTRSSTQSLIDLTKTTDIDVSNVSFDSTGQPTFDGTDDYINKTRNQYAITDNWSVEVIFKPTDDSDTSWNGLFGGNLGAGGYWMFHNSGKLTYYEGSDGTSRITYRPWTKANTFNQNVYHHLVITYTSTGSTTGTFNLYYNGGEKTDSFNWTFTFSHSLDSNYIGMGGGNRFGTNDIQVYREFNRVITPAEVQQNYKAYKNRFNL